MGRQGEVIKGFYTERIDKLAHEIAIYDRDKDCFITFEFKAHKAIEQGLVQPTTLISINDYNENILRALAEALTKMGLMNESATTSELRATKYHLEDMRALVGKYTEQKPTQPELK